MSITLRPRRLLLAACLAATACGTAFADRAPPQQAGALVPAPEPPRSPYEVDLLAEDGRALSTYQHRGRYYVLGRVGQRYTIRVSNPTDRRIEAVIAVDGLDAIDGQSADYTRKRGYVVPARGELRVDGFRVSTSQVATFRFSSVASSYAGRQGKARNVGVIGVAIFEERAAPEIIVSEPRPPHRPAPRRHYDFDDTSIEGELSPSHAEQRGAGGRDVRPPEPTPSPEPSPSGVSGGRGSGSDSVSRSVRRPAPPAPPRSQAPGQRRAPPADERTADRPCCGARPQERPGLGTEFGERRQSAVSWTQFERANLTTPTAMAELRYNDAEGLRALGIRIGPAVDAEELATRETADPFPATRFSQPPR